MKSLKYKDGISVIVTLFNKEEYIIQTLRSATNQFNKKKYGYQIIVVDDNSTDSSYQLAKDFLNQSKIDYKIIKQSNSGPSIATNNALKFIKYSFIKILDGDDILSPDSLHYMKTQMEKKFIDLLYGDWVWVKDPIKFKFRENSPVSTIMEDPINQFILNGWGGASNIMIRTEVMNEIGGCDDKIFVQDFSIPIRVAGNHLKKKNSKRFCIGRSDKIVCVGPSNIDQRVMSIDGQTLYDYSIGSLNFINDYPLLDSRIRKRVIKKIISRCWSWRRRNSKAEFFDRFFLTYILSKFNFGLSNDIVRYHVYKTWIDNINVRKNNKSDKRKLKILVYVGLDLLGDALLKVPFLTCLRKIFPNSEITWMAGKGESIFNSKLKPLSIGLIDRIFDEYNFGSSFWDFFKKDLGEYDIVIDTQKRLLTTLILKKIKSKIFISPCANFIFSDLVPITINEPNLSRSLVQLSEIFSNQKINYKLSQRSKNSKKIALCPGASVIWKKWDLENFIELAKYILKLKLTPTFILGPKEKDIRRNLLREFDIKVKILSTDNPMETIKIAEKCRAGVSNDTGCGHLLAISGIPMITIFGPTDHKKFSPLGNKNNLAISSQEIFKSKNINTIPPDFVINKLKVII